MFQKPLCCWNKKKNLSSSYFVQPGSDRLGTEQKDESGSWCLPTLGPCLPNLYERGSVITRQAFRRKHFQPRGAGGGDAGSHPPPPARWSGCLRLSSTTKRHPPAGPGGLRFRGSHRWFYQKSMDVSKHYLVDGNFSGPPWSPLLSGADIAGYRGSRGLPLGFYSRSAGKTAELIFASALPSGWHVPWLSKVDRRHK